MRNRTLPAAGPRAAAGWLAAAAAAVCLAAMVPCAAYASSPEFSRTEEEWARLRDNRMEFDELEGLIQEYNTTVQNNQYQYRKFLNDYGDTNADVAGAYNDLAADLYDMISGDDSASGMMQDLNLRIQADNMLKQSSETLEDSRIYLLTYEKAEKSLAASAQSGFIEYHKLLLTRQDQEEAVGGAQESLADAELKRAAGTATELDVLNAAEALRTAEDRLAATERSIAQRRESLNIMLGWKYDDQPEMGGLPDPDEGALSALDPAADLAAALENNYTLKINLRKLENAKDGDTKNDLQTTIANNRTKIGNALNSAYRSVQNARLTLSQANARTSLEEQNLAIAGTRLAAGMITQRAYNAQARTAQSARRAAERARMDLLSAGLTYQWTRDGLAAAE